MAATLVGAIAVVAVAIAVSSGGKQPAKVVKPNSPAAKAAQSKVNALLAGIPQSGDTLGNPKAKVYPHRVRRPRLPGMQGLRARRRGTN